MTARRDRNWTIVTLTYRDPVPVSAEHPSGYEHRCERYVVYTPLKSIAEVAIEAWFDADQSRRENLNEVSYYPRNYVDMERDLRLAGRIIESEPTS